jgi:hypothetical protein
MQTSRGARIAGWIGLALHLLALVWYAASTLVAPGWAVVGLLVVWAAVLVAAIRLMRTRPLLVAAVPLLDAAIWVAVVWAGETFLGWTA